MTQAIPTGVTQPFSWKTARCRTTPFEIKRHLLAAKSRAVKEGSLIILERDVPRSDPSYLASTHSGRIRSLTQPL
jgi:hypothetical protein